MVLGELGRNSPRRPRNGLAPHCLEHPSTISCLERPPNPGFFHPQSTLVIHVLHLPSAMLVDAESTSIPAAGCDAEAAAATGSSWGNRAFEPCCASCEVGGCLKDAAYITIVEAHVDGEQVVRVVLIQAGSLAGCDALGRSEVTANENAQDVKEAVRRAEGRSGSSSNNRPLPPLFTLTAPSSRRYRP